MDIVGPLLSIIEIIEADTRSLDYKKCSVACGVYMGRATYKSSTSTRRSPP